MAKKRAASVLFYAINGRGLGHLTRLLAIARAARELCDALEVSCDFQFITTSEASSIAEDFPVYKLPSKTVFARQGALRDQYLLHAKLLVSNLVAAKNPDLLVLDTVPYGAFQEFAFLKSYARATAYVYRHQDESVATSPIVQRHLELFDRIVVPDESEARDEYPLPRAARRRVAFVGAIHGYDVARAWPAERVREYFGVPHGKRLIYVSAGGGGDGRGEIDTLVRQVAGDDRNFVLAGYGPLHRGECIYAPNVVPLLDGNASRYFAGVDAAVSAAGENSYQELLAARVPTLFFAQDKGLDRQDRRIRRGLEQSFHGTFDPAGDRELFRARLEELFDQSSGARIRAALASRAAPRGALLAAVDLLSLCASFGDLNLERSALVEVASWRRDAPVDLAPSFVTSARAYRGWRALATSVSEIASERDRCLARWHDPNGSESEALARGTELSELKNRIGADDEAWLAILRAFATHPESRSQELRHQELVDALRALCDDEHRARVVELAHSVSHGHLRRAIMTLLRETDAFDGDAEPLEFGAEA